MQPSLQGWGGLSKPPNEMHPYYITQQLNVFSKPGLGPNWQKNKKIKNEQDMATSSLQTPESLAK